jgi:hypothetical protein
VNAVQYVQAILATGLFGWYGYAIAFDALPGDGGSSSKSRILHVISDALTAQLGPVFAGALIAFAGFVLATYFIARAR